MRRETIFVSCRFSEDFSIQFSLLYLSMKYLTIIWELWNTLYNMYICVYNFKKIFLKY